MDVVNGHLDHNDLIGHMRLMNGKLCLTNLLDFFEDVTNRIDKGDLVDVIYLNCQKALDKVPHRGSLARNNAKVIPCFLFCRNATMYTYPLHSTTGHMNQTQRKSNYNDTLLVSAIFSTIAINLVTIAILSQGKCGLSKCVTCYLVAMAAADLLVVIFDLILRHIPIVYLKHFLFLKYSIPVCNIHAALLFAATDCSVWFTVTFTFDRFVAICCQKLKTKYCTRKTSAIVLGTVTVLSCLKNISRYFMLSGQYWLRNEPWFCFATTSVLYSQFWTIIEFLHYILTPFVPFLVILLLNVLTVRHIVVSSRARRRLRANSNGESSRDSEMESRRKSIILLLVISANYVLLWAVLMVYSIWNRMWYLGNGSEHIPVFLQEIGFMLQLLSCCTNTCIYAVTQTQFREHLKTVLKYPFSPITKLIK
ncbi:probable G-protein coupled receptor 139 [Heterodontus francisci]|uniref:probable G-protein coupled receptor 139 n=1 Tax=Heterodontus francisci TaxID=7792 RepID=UPI00355ADE79